MTGYSAFIFARGGSKGVPRKNIRMVAGKPLIAYSIASALASQQISRVIVSTDDEEIAAISKEYGASEILMRAPELAADTTPEILAWRHAIDSYPNLFTGANTQPFISLPATSPLRAPEDVDGAIAAFARGGNDIVFGISHSCRNPYLNMVVIGNDDRIRIALAGSNAVRRQDVPDMYDVCSVYVADVDYICSCDKLIDGRVGYVMIPQERALDIDTPFDMYLADILLSHPYKK